MPRFHDPSLQRKSLNLREINMISKFLLLTSGRPRIRTQPSGFLGESSCHLIPLLLQLAHSPLWLQTHATCPGSKGEIFLKPNSTHGCRKHASCSVLATVGDRATRSNTSRPPGGTWGAIPILFGGREIGAEWKVVNSLTH